MRKYFLNAIKELCPNAPEFFDALYNIYEKRKYENTQYLLKRILQLSEQERRKVFPSSVYTEKEIINRIFEEKANRIMSIAGLNPLVNVDARKKQLTMPIPPFAIEKKTNQEVTQIPQNTIKEKIKFFEAINHANKKTDFQKTLPHSQKTRRKQQTF